MAYSSWNLKLIKEQYDGLVESYNKTGDESFLVDIQMLSMMLDSDKEIVCFEKNDNPTLQLNDNLLAFYDNITFMPYIHYFSKLKTAKRKIPELSIYEQNFSMLLSFVHDFYNSMPLEIKSKFNHSFKDRKDTLKFSDNRSITIFIPHLRTSYLNVKIENTIEDYMNIAHEYAHSIVDLIYYRENYRSNYPFVEFVPLLMELIACDFLDGHYEVSQDVKLYRAHLWKSINIFCKELVMEGNYYSKVNVTNYFKNPVKGLARTNNTSINDAEKILDIPTIEKFAYATPFIVAVEFYYLYRQDLELFYKYLMEFITLPPDSDYIEELEKRNIYLNEHSELFLEEINHGLKNVSR